MSPASQAPSAHALARRLLRIYAIASSMTVIGGAALYGFGLDLTTRQIALGLGVIAPLSLAAVFAADLLVIRRTLAPLQAFLRAPAGPVEPAVTRAALVRAMNLPALSALRVMLVHVPTAAVSITLLMLILNRYMALGIDAGQIVILWLMTVFIGAGHAVFEYFSVAEVLRPVTRIIWARVDDLPAEARRGIVLVDTKRVLVFVAIFMVFVPLLALGFTVTVKLNNLLTGLRLPDVELITAPLYTWIVLLIATSTGGVLFLAVRAAREITRAVREMADGMQRVERDELDAHLTITNASEFVPLYEGFNTMASRLQADAIERERAEAALRESEERFRAMAESAADAIISADDDGRIISWNPGAEAIFGYTKEEALGRPLTDLVPERDRQGRRRGFDRLMAPGQTRRTGTMLEMHGVRKDGTEFPLELSLATWQTRLGSFFTTIIRDVTTRKQLEEQFRQSQKLESLGRLAGGVAHDFSNLLMLIMGQADLLEELDAPEPLRRRVGVIRTAADRAAALTKQLLAFSRKQVLQPRVLDLNEILRRLETMLRRLVGEDIELGIRLAPGPAHVRADPTQIEQVIINLVVNARDAMPHGGTLSLETDLVELDAAGARRQAGIPAGAYVRLTVSDTGVGMDAETQSHIFEPFFTTKGPDKGTGLGLATVFGIVKQSGGEISVTSDPGRGASFRVHLPRAEEPIDPVEAGPAPSRLRGTETVLVAEDDAMVRSLIREVLEQRGYTVLAAEHGTDALEIARQQAGPIHLLVTDVVMPVINGRELADRLVASRPELRVLYISGYTGETIGRHGVFDPGVAFLAKPIEPDTLARRIRELLDGAPGG